MDERFYVKIKELYKKSILNNYPHRLPLCKGELEGVVYRYWIRLFWTAPYPLLSHRRFTHATARELITPPTILKTPTSKLSAICDNTALKLNVENIPIKK